MINCTCTFDGIRPNEWPHIFAAVPRAGEYVWNFDGTARRIVDAVEHETNDRGEPIITLILRPVIKAC